MKPINYKISAHFRFVIVCLDRMHPSIQCMGMCTGLEEWSVQKSISYYFHCKGPIIAGLVLGKVSPHMMEKPQATSTNRDLT